MITGGYGGVSVIDTDPASATYNKEIARIIRPRWAYRISSSAAEQTLRHRMG